MSEIAENEFRDIPNFEGLYQINRKGVVKSLPKYTGNGYLRGEIIIKNIKDNNGYYTISLCKINKRKKYNIHNLLYRTFIGDYDSKYFQIDHINRIRIDNRLENLRIVSSRDNNNNRTDQSELGCVVTLNGKKYKTRIRINNKKIYFGVFDTPEESHKKYLEIKSKIEEIEKVTRNYDFKLSKIGKEYFIEFLPIL